MQKKKHRLEYIVELSKINIESNQQQSINPTLNIKKFLIITLIVFIV